MNKRKLVYYACIFFLYNFKKQLLKIWGSHNGGHEVYCHLGYNAV
jgi:hypothetical protein